MIFNAKYGALECPANFLNLFTELHVFLHSAEDARQIAIGFYTITLQAYREN